jgi:ribosomal protein L22
MSAEEDMEGEARGNPPAKPPASEPSTRADSADDAPAQRTPAPETPADKEPAATTQATAKKAPQAKKGRRAKKEPAAEKGAVAEKEPVAEKPVAKKAAAANKEATAEKEPAAAKVPAKQTTGPSTAPKKRRALSVSEASKQLRRRRVVRAHARYVRTSARKARIVCGHLRGKSVQEARAILAFTPREAARDWSKLLESAVANAESNHELLEEDLIVREAFADEGPTIKRFRPRAMGRATAIRKRTTHLTIALTVGSTKTTKRQS